MAGAYVQGADRPSRTPADAVRAAREDDGLVLLEGVHALKHAVRFGARIDTVLSPDAAGLHALLAGLAPDVRLPCPVVELSQGAWAGVVGRALPSPSLAIAHRPSVDPAAVLTAPGRIVVLEQPRHLGNLGATIRVAAAAGAGGVLVLGAADPWHPTAVRTAAGLQFALNVARADALPPTSRPVVALDAGGEALPGLPADAVLVAGTEREGLSAGILARADLHLAIPMRPGVSSLNLATAVAVALYHA
jgi:RNA methyltransferase, TrmH family